MPSTFTFSEPGGHEVNEDSFGVQVHFEDKNCVICALADGQGGQAGGAQAAHLATRSVLETAMTHSPKSVFSTGCWDEILQQADSAVLSDPEAGFTTLIGFAVGGDLICGASCGDSAVLLNDGMGRLRELTRRQTKNPPVGSGAAYFTPFASYLAEGWLVVVMSDGVWKFVGWERVSECVSKIQGQPLIEALQGFARLPGSGRFQDDFTVIVIQDKI